MLRQGLENLDVELRESGWRAPGRRRRSCPGSRRPGGWGRRPGPRAPCRRRSDACRGRHRPARRTPRPKPSSSAPVGWLPRSPRSDRSRGGPGRSRPPPPREGSPRGPPSRTNPLSAPVTSMADSRKRRRKSKGSRSAPSRRRISTDVLSRARRSASRDETSTSEIGSKRPMTPPKLIQSPLGEGRARGLDAVDERPVLAPQILQAPAGPAPLEPRVALRDAAVFQHEPALRLASDDKGLPVAKDEKPRGPLRRMKSESCGHPRPLRSRRRRRRVGRRRRWVGRRRGLGPGKGRLHQAEPQRVRRGAPEAGDVDPAVVGPPDIGDRVAALGLHVVQTSPSPR